MSSEDASGNCLDIIDCVSKGSILRPLLFLMYVNNLFKASSSLMEVTFADDKNVCLIKSLIHLLLI